jgi:hypothetical protein
VVVAGGVPREQITEIRRAFRDTLRRALGKTEMVSILRERGLTSPLIAEMAEFIAQAKRPVCPGHGKVPRVLATWLVKFARGDNSVAALAQGDEYDDE